MKQQKISDFSKIQAEEIKYANQQRGEKAAAAAIKVEQAKKMKLRAHNQVRKKADAKDMVGQERNNIIKDQIDKQNLLRKEAAKLRAEDQ